MLKKLFYLNLTFLIFSCWSHHEKENTSVRTERAIQSINGTNITVNGLDNFLKAQMESLSIPGLSFAYLSDNRLIYSNNFGVTNTESKNPVTDSTLFDAASISKTVFSFFVLQMVDKGKINLDTPLYKYLENPDIKHDERYKKITARMALSHTTGFPNWRYLTNTGYDPNGKLRIEFEPGTQYQYSGEGFKYLAQVIAHVLDTNMNGLQEIMEKELFKPLGMSHSSFVWNDYLETYRADGHINENLDPGWSSSAKNPNFNAAAGLQTNATAYGNFLTALMSGNLLSESGHNEMLKVQSSRSETTDRPGVNYGLGVIIDTTAYGVNYAHSGDNGSATSQFLFNKKHKSGYVFFTNMENKRMQIFNSNLQKFLLKSE